MGEREAPVGVVLVDAGSGPSRAAAVLADDDRLELLARTADLRTAARLVTDTRPQVVVVEMDDAGTDAVGAIGSLTAQVPEAPVLALSGADDHDGVLAAVRAGAAGYLVKTVRVAELVDAITRTAAGDAVFSPGLAGVVLEEYGRLAGPGGEPPRLTDREADVLRLVVDGLTARQIASRLVLSQRTVENHVQHVLRKLRLHNRAALVRYAIEHGLA